MNKDIRKINIDGASKIGEGANGEVYRISDDTIVKIYRPGISLDASELLRLIEVGASCFNHYCVGYDDTQLNVLHNVHRRLVWAIPSLLYIMF